MKYRKKPVVIEAIQLKDDNAAAPEWLLCAYDSGLCSFDLDQMQIVIKTLEGEMRGNIGDWIIRGLKGELYPCKPDVFAATYEPAE